MPLLGPILILLIPFYVMLWLLLLFERPLIAVLVLLTGLATITLSLLRFTRRLERINAPATPVQAESRWHALRLIGPDLIGILLGTAILVLLAVFLSLFVAHSSHP